MDARVANLEHQLSCLRDLVSTLQDGWIRVPNPLGGELYVNASTQSSQLDAPLQLKGPPNYAQLQQTVQQLQQTVQRLENQVTLSQRQAKTPKLTRISVPLCTNEQLNVAVGSPVIRTAQIPGIPENTFAVIVAVKASPQNHPGGHLYYNFEVYQQGSQGDTTKTTCLNEQRFDCHGNVYVHEIVVPWNSTLPAIIECKFLYALTDGSYPNHGNINHLNLSVTGTWST
jgi:hypothetical protein